MAYLSACHLSVSTHIFCLILSFDLMRTDRLDAREYAEVFCCLCNNVLFLERLSLNFSLCIISGSDTISTTANSPNTKLLKRKNDLRHFFHV